MLTAIRRAWLRMQLTMVQIETAQAEQADATCRATSRN